MLPPTSRMPLRFRQPQRRCLSPLPVAKSETIVPPTATPAATETGRIKGSPRRTQGNQWAVQGSSAKASATPTPAPTPSPTPVPASIAKGITHYTWQQVLDGEIDHDTQWRPYRPWRVFHPGQPSRTNRTKRDADITTEQNFNPQPTPKSRATVIHQKTVRATDGDYQVLIITQRREFVAKAQFGYTDASNEERVLRSLDAAAKQTMAGAGIPSMQTVINDILFRSARRNYGCHCRC